MTKMAGDALALAQGWVEEIHHLAGHAGLESSAQIAQATVKLGEARNLLAHASDELENGPHEHGFEVELV
jgi:hypothetical protein